MAVKEFSIINDYRSWLWHWFIKQNLGAHKVYFILEHYVYWQRLIGIENDKIP